MNKKTGRFISSAKKNETILKEVNQFLIEFKVEMPEDQESIWIYQDGMSGSYYIKCDIASKDLDNKIDFDARLNPESSTSYRANRELLLNHNTFKKMKRDALGGREFNDIIVEYNKDYSPLKPLKIWGGQHRLKAIEEAFKENAKSSYHGLRVYFKLTKAQRTDLALISNTNIAVSNDLFDRAIEETQVGTNLREWCIKVGLLTKDEDFPDKASTSDKISVRLARTFIVNFYKGKEKADELSATKIDKNIYIPHLCESGTELDSEYERILGQYSNQIWKDPELLSAGKSFVHLHKQQKEAVMTKKVIENRKGFRDKALTVSVLAAWSFTAGLLQKQKDRLVNLYNIANPNKESPDPLNAKIMSEFKHDQDPPTYRGLGTRSSTKDRQRMVQVFLAKSNQPNQRLTKKLLNQAVSQVIGIDALQKGYS
jgi:hypothetical protein